MSTLRKRIEGLTKFRAPKGSYLDYGHVLNVIAEHEKECDLLVNGRRKHPTVDVQPASIPKWRQELERTLVSQFYPSGSDDYADTAMHAKLCELESLYRVIESGKGEAAVPDGVVSLILKNWDGLRDGWTLRSDGHDEFMLSSPSRTYTYCNDSKYFLGLIDTFGNALVGP